MLWPQHADLVTCGKPERLVHPHDHTKWPTFLHGDVVGGEPIGCDIQVCQRVFRQHRDPHVIAWSDEQAIEPTFLLPWRGDVVGGEGAGGWIEAKQQIHGEYCQPDTTVGIAGNFHR